MIILNITCIFVVCRNISEEIVLTIKSTLIEDLATDTFYYIKVPEQYLTTPPDFIG